MGILHDGRRWPAWHRLTGIAWVAALWACGGAATERSPMGMETGALPAPEERGAGSGEDALESFDFGAMPHHRGAGLPEEALAVEGVFRRASPIRTEDGETIAGEDCLRLHGMADGALEYDLVTVGPSGHTCAIRGTVIIDGAVWGDDRPTAEGETCRMELRFMAPDVEVTDVGGRCAAWFCGVHAELEGVFPGPVSPDDGTYCVIPD